MEKQPLSISPKSKSEVSTSGSPPFAIGCKGVPLATINHKNSSDMPDTTKDNPGKDVHYPYDQETQRDRKVDKAEKPRKKQSNKQKEDWLNGDGPQTD